ncbi:hypothetical protein OG512_48900 [Streptomyces sp. NBC_01378]
MNRQLTVQESHHKFARDICHGSQPSGGGLRRRDPAAAGLDEDDEE